MRRVIAGEPALFEVLMRRYNQRLFRVARAILRDEAEAEDVMQQAYVNAYAHLGQFAERARFGTWLTRIAVHEAFGRLRRRGRFEEADAMPDWEERTMDLIGAAERNPEQQALRREMRALLRQELLERAGLVSAELFPLHLSRFNRVVAAVLDRLDLAPPEPPRCSCPRDGCHAAASSPRSGPMVS